MGNDSERLQSEDYLREKELAMKKMVEKEVEFCDNCGSDDCVFNECNGCGKHFCYDCNEDKGMGKKYIHSVYCSGTGDAYLCNDCLSRPTPKVTGILRAYEAVQRLRVENENWQKDFGKRCEAAKAETKRVAEKYKIR